MANDMRFPWHKVVQRNILETIYKSYIRPILEYADSCTAQHKTNIESIQIRAAHKVTGAKRHTSHSPLVFGHFTKFRSTNRVHEI